MAQDIPTVEARFTKTLNGIGAILAFTVFFIDVQRSYLLSAGIVMRDVFYKLPEGLRVKCKELLQLRQPLHGLADSCNYCDHMLRFILLN